MRCRYCKIRIVWSELEGWLEATVTQPFGLWGTAACPERPEGEGGPHAGHRLEEDVKGLFDADRLFT